MSCKRKRTDLYLSQKLEIIQLASDKTFQTDMAARSRLYRRYKPESRPSARCNGKIISENVLERPADDVEKVFFTWFTDVRVRDAPVTTLILEEKAKQFATALDKLFSCTL